MNAYYIQKANSIYPIFGVNSFEEAKQYCDESDYRYIVETCEDVYMNPSTGSVGFLSDWDETDGLVRVEYNPVIEEWEAA